MGDLFGTLVMMLFSFLVGVWAVQPTIPADTVEIIRSKCLKNEGLKEFQYIRSSEQKVVCNDNAIFEVKPNE